MDYFNIYNDDYSFFFKEFKKTFFESLLTSKNKISHTFNAAKDNLYDSLLKKWKTDKGYELLNSNTDKFYRILRDAHKIYENDAIKNVLEIDIKKAFENLEVEKKSIFNNYQDLIKSLVCQKVYYDFIIKLEVNQKVLCTLYELKQIEAFDFENKIDYQNKIEGYDSMYKSLFPNEKKEGNLVNPDLLNEKEKYLLLHVLFSFFKENKKPTMIEIAKIITLANVYDENFLTDKYKNRDGYKILLNGHNFRDNTNVQKEWINGLLEKIKPYKLTQANAKLRLELKKFN